MAVKQESRLQRRIQAALAEEFPGCVIYKIHGNEFQVAGIPDLICCVDGRFFGLEVKTDTGFASPAQLYEIERIEQAGGIARVVRSVEEAIRVVRTFTPRAKRRR